MVKRNTIQLSLVYETVNRLQGHATADEVYDAIAREHPHISRGTVYRNLNRLSESGRLRKVAIPDSADRFECGGRDHYHARCVRCGRVVDVDMPYMAELEQSIRDPRGFAFIGHDILFQGVCPACREQASAHTGA